MVGHDRVAALTTGGQLIRRKRARAALLLPVLIGMTVGHGAHAQLQPNPAPIVPYVERSDITAIRKQIAALRSACAALPASLLSTQRTTPPATSKELPTIERPYAAEETVCKAALDPSRDALGEFVSAAVLGGSFGVLGLLFAYTLFRLIHIMLLTPVEEAFTRYRHNRRLRHGGTIS